MIWVACSLAACLLFRACRSSVSSHDGRNSKRWSNQIVGFVMMSLCTRHKKKLGSRISIEAQTKGEELNNECRQPH